MPRQINYTQIRAKLLKSKRVRENLDERVEERVEKAREELISDFMNHDVTQEILHPENGNISETLDSKDNKSLFGFIGFDAGSNPIEPIQEALEEQTKLVGSKVVGQTQIEYKIQHPSLKELYSQTPMPWESGRSWLYGISHGISGFAYFLAGYFENLNHSRSGQGIQLEDSIRGGSFKVRKDYIEAMIAKFRSRFKKGTN